MSSNGNEIVYEMDPELVFDDIEPVRVPVKIAGKDYTLQEASEGQVVAWRNSSLRGMQMTDGKITAFKNVADADMTLMQSCLTENRESGVGKPVSLEFLKALNHRIFKPIFDRLKKISYIGEGAEKADPKGEASTTGATSDLVTN